MLRFGKKETIVLFSEAQKDSYIEKLENAHVDYSLREEQSSIFSENVHYIVKVNAADLKKVV